MTLSDITTTANITIGRKADCEIQLQLNMAAIDNPMTWSTLLSRRHALLQWDEPAGHWAIEDLKSVNGVLVNGVKVKRTALKLGDLVAFGRANGREDGTAVQDELTPYKFRVIEGHGAAAVAAAAEEVETGTAVRMASSGHSVQTAIVATVDNPNPKEEVAAASSKNDSELEPEPKRRKVADGDGDCGTVPKRRMSRETRETMECALCFELMVRPMILSCGHSFCTTCTHQVERIPHPTILWFGPLRGPRAKCKAVVLSTTPNMKPEYETASYFSKARVCTDCAPTG